MIAKQRAAGLLGLLLLLNLYVFGQDTQFGKNKVQYTKFSYYFIQSDHFDLYFTEGGESLAEFTAAAAESAYARISKSFRYQLVNRIPFIVYNSHNDFQQTNVISEYLEEGNMGMTSFTIYTLVPRANASRSSADPSRT